MLGIGNYLWRLIPANPILLRVVEGGSKRRRDLLIRCGYLGVLVFLVFFLLLQSAEGFRSASLASLAKQSASMFRWMSYVQLGLVALLAPIFTAGAITQERDSQTYDILLSTPLTNGQIVLGSLLSRLFFVIALLVSGIPIFSITQIFGGVSIHSIMLAFGIAAATAFVTGALAMAIAVFKVGTRRTIFSFYLFTALYLAIPLAIEWAGKLQIPGPVGGKSVPHISWFAGIHPFLALRVIFNEPMYQPPSGAAIAGHGWPLNWYLSSPHTFYISFMFFVTMVLVVPAIVFLRRLAQTNISLRSWALQLLHLGGGDRTRRPRRVWLNPIAWREAKTKASAARAMLLRWLFILAGVGGAIVLLVLNSTDAKVSKRISSTFDPKGTTIQWVEDGAPQKPVSFRADGESSTAVKINGSAASPRDLRPGMAVDEVKVDPNSNVLSSISVIERPTVLSRTDCRKFLLGAIMIELAVILLIVTNAAASTVTREKEDGTLDLLLITPITSRYYVWGKLRGLVSFVLPLLAVPVFSVALFAVADIVRHIGGRGDGWVIFPESVFVLPGTLVLVAAFAAILGMQMSLRCRTTVMAVMSSVGIVGGVCLALGMCGLSILKSADQFWQFSLVVSCFSPFTQLALVTHPQEYLPAVFAKAPDDIGWARGLIFLFGLAATAAYAGVVWAMYQAMVKNFDITVRKQAK